MNDFVCKTLTDLPLMIHQFLRRRFALIELSFLPMVIFAIPEEMTLESQKHYAVAIVFTVQGPSTRA